MTPTRLADSGYPSAARDDSPRSAQPFDVLAWPLAGINLIEASAGTGKTWTLCALYVRLLLERDLEVGEILVVTFTNAATAELRERVRVRLAEVLRAAREGAAGGVDAFAIALVEALAARGIDRGTIARQLDRALQAFDEAAIFTIHGFCQRALADASFTAREPFALELVPDDRELDLEVARDFWRREIASPERPAALGAYLAQSKDSPAGFAELLARRIAKPLARLVWPDDLDRAPELDTAPLEAAFTAARATWLDTREEVERMLLTAAGSILNRSSYKRPALARALAGWHTYFEGEDPLASLPRDAKLELCRASRLVAATTGRNDPPSHAFCEQADALLAERERLFGELRRARLRLVREFLERAPAMLRERKREKRVVGYDDILSRLYAALHAPGEGDALAALLRARFPAALVDEFQDTDPVQWGIFDRIYGAGDCPMFLVGDPKQAIYRFRHADLETYLRARSRAAREYTLAENQRSTASLIEAVNGLFGRNPHAFVLAGLEHHDVRPGARTRRALHDAEGGADFRIWMLPERDARPIARKDAFAAAATATTAEIARLVRAGGRGEIMLGGAPLAPRDIAVLVRSHAQGLLVREQLRAAGIASVELAQASVFASTDAEEIERLLLAVLHPANAGLVRSALATELLGCDAAGIEALSGDDAGLLAPMARFDGYRAAWLQRGVGHVFRQLLLQEGVSARMLARPDGERRLTNVLHLGERLQEAAERHRAPEALLRWLHEQRSEPRAHEEAQLRLESDRNLVQIVTIHKAKGLEYPIVFCPFAWDGYPLRPNEWPGAQVYHAPDGELVVDFRDKEEQGPDEPAIKWAVKREALAESVRLLYVALTRASHRAYLVAGCYTTGHGAQGSVKESTHSMLNWLAAGTGPSLEAWCDSRSDAAVIGDAWESLAAARPNAIALGGLPADPPQPLEDSTPAPDTLAAAVPPARIAPAWRIGSYSALSFEAVSEAAAVDHDARIAAASARPAPSDLAAHDILAFPRGALAGECLHAVLERVDFAAPPTWARAIDAALAAYPLAAGRIARERLAAMIEGMLRDLASTELLPGLRLAEVARTRRLTELEFSLPCPALSAAELNAVLARHGYPGPQLAFPVLEGYLKGFVDLVFEHAGRFYVLDWKSNHLGYTSADYGPEPLAAAMAEQGYHLQHLLYTLALDRYLRSRVPGYRFDEHFGGVLYLFVRAVRPAWRTSEGAAAGVYFHRLEPVVLRELDRLFPRPARAFAS